MLWPLDICMSENNHIFCKLGGYSYAVTVLLFFGGVCMSY